MLVCRNPLTQVSPHESSKHEVVLENMFADTVIFQGGMHFMRY